MCTKTIQAITKRKIILIGGGGHCRSSIDVILSTGLYSIAGILDAKEKVGQVVLGIPIIDTDDDLESIKKKCDCFAITVGQIKTAAVRMRIFERLNDIKAELPGIIATTARVSAAAELGRGTIVYHHAFINAAARVGENCIINSGALLEHDTEVGSHCHISTSAVLNGHVVVEDQTFIGSNATVLPGVHIGFQSVIGAGSVVLKNVGSNKIMAGNPAVSIGSND